MGKIKIELLSNQDLIDYKKQLIREVQQHKDSLFKLELILRDCDLQIKKRKVNELKKIKTRIKFCPYCGGKNITRLEKDREHYYCDDCCESFFE